jgi:PAS domain S-box-containing protein
MGQHDPDRALAALHQRIASLERELSQTRHERDTLNHILQGIHDAVIALDSAFCITSWNEGAERIYGWRAAEVLGRPLGEVLETRFTAGSSLDEAQTVLRATGIWHGRVIQSHRSGRDLLIESTVRTVYAADGVLVGLVAINRDVGDEVMVSLDTLFEHIPAGLALYEVTPDYRCLRHNAQFLPMVGSAWQRRGSIIGVPVYELFPDEVAAHILRMFETVRTTGQVFSVDEYQAILLPERQPRYYRLSMIPIHNWSGAIAAALVSAVEITPYKRAQDLLRLRDRALDATTTGIMITGPAEDDYPLIYCNPAFERITGYRRDEVLGRNCRMLQGAETNPATIAAIREGLRRVEAFQVLIRNYRKDGAAFWNELSIAPVFDEQGQASHFIGIITDVTARKEAEIERLNLERRLQETQKLESLGVLAGGIAHDFNNLLVSILGNAELALLDLAPEAPARPTVEQIVLAAHRAADLTRQLLAYAGKGRFVVQPLSLNAIVEEMIHLLRASIPKHVTLQYHLAEGLPAIEADATQMRQVVMNLVVNAAEAIGDESGVVRIASGMMHADRAYLRSLVQSDDLPEGTYVFLEVSDNGRGMDATTQARIFEPFFTTKATGRGLGLAAVLGIVRGHRGGLRVYSEPGRGSSFKLLMPASGEAVALADRALPVDPARCGRGVVLLIDDEAEVRAVIARMLARLGFEVATAADGAAGLVLFEAQAARLVCVLLDLTMPQMGGVEVFRQMRQRAANVPVVLMSGYNEQEVITQFAGKGLAAFLQKPFTPVELQRVLQQLNLLDPAGAPGR